MVEAVLEICTESEQTPALLDVPAEQVLFRAGSASVGLLKKTAHFRRVLDGFQFVENSIDIFSAHHISPSLSRKDLGSPEALRGRGSLLHILQR
jgi:hypothetical protein